MYVNNNTLSSKKEMCIFVQTKKRYNYNYFMGTLMHVYLWCIVSEAS